MDKQEFKKLLDKYLDGVASEHEIALIERYTDLFLEKDTQPVFSSEEEREHIRYELHQRIRVDRSKRSVGWLKIAASVLVLIGLGTGFWLGRAWVLTPEMVVVNTGNGERQVVQLSDGSEIHLNANSSLEYPVKFDGGKRPVKLSGEAYFSVAKDAHSPFQVYANGTQTSVLGTEFNVSAYPEDLSVSVSLLEGSVRVEGMQVDMLLKPGEQARFDLETGEAGVSTFDSTNIVAWRTGGLVLDHTTFAQLARIIRRQFGVNVRFGDASIATYTISGRFDDPKLATVLASVTAAKELGYKVTSEKDILIYLPE